MPTRQVFWLYFKCHDLQVSTFDTFRPGSLTRLSIFSYIFFIKAKLHSFIWYPSIRCRLSDIRVSGIRLSSINLVPRLFLRERKDPGRSWSRATQILGGKLKQHLGRGGRVLRLENYNLCA